MTAAFFLSTRRYLPPLKSLLATETSRSQHSIISRKICRLQHRVISRKSVDHNIAPFHGKSADHSTASFHGKSADLSMLHFTHSLCTSCTQSSLFSFFQLWVSIFLVAEDGAIHRMDGFFASSDFTERSADYSMGPFQFFI